MLTFAAEEPSQMIEVLVSEKLELLQSTEIVVFDRDDALQVKESLARLAIDWPIKLRLNSTYKHNMTHKMNCTNFLNRSIEQPQWKGDGLEFDDFRTVPE